MNKTEIEAWALRTVDAVERGEAVEDLAVELKRDWPDPAKAARRIAAHANAAGGTSILWIVGLDEKTGVTAYTPTDPATWWPQVAKHFDEDNAPPVDHVVVTVRPGQSVVALCFATDRPPYVVKNADGKGVIQREVPWREGAQTRSARRSDLIRMLEPLRRVPHLEIVESNLEVRLTRVGNAGSADAPVDPSPAWRLDLTAYLSARPGSYLAFRERLMRFELRPDESSTVWTPNETPIVSATRPGRSFMGHRTDEPRVQTIQEGVDQLLVEGPGYVWFVVKGRIPAIRDQIPAVNVFDEVRLRLHLPGVDLPVPVTAQATLARASISEAKNFNPLIGHWLLSDA